MSDRPPGTDSYTEGCASMISPVSGSVVGSRRKSTNCSDRFSCAATSAGKCCLRYHWKAISVSIKTGMVDP